MSYQGEIGGLLDIVERGCRRLMITGGGSLGVESRNSNKPVIRITAEQRARAIELGRAGKHSFPDIANIIGANYQATYKVLLRAGIKAGRK